MGAMAVAIGYALKAQPLRCFPLCKWVLRPISWAERTARRLQAPFPIFVFAASCFRTCNVGNKNGLPRTFSSGRVTFGICQCAFQASLCHFPILPYISSLVNL